MSYLFLNGSYYLCTDYRYSYVIKMSCTCYIQFIIMAKQANFICVLTTGTLT